MIDGFGPDISLLVARRRPWPRQRGPASRLLAPFVLLPLPCDIAELLGSSDQHLAHSFLRWWGRHKGSATTATVSQLRPLEHQA